MRKLYSDPALKNNKKWTVYTTQSLYKQYKTEDIKSEYGLMVMCNEALSIYIELFSDIQQLHKEAAEKNMELTEYIVSIVKNRNQ